MNQIQYHKPFFIILFIGLIFSKSVEPIESNNQEVLKIYGKDRIYYELIKDTLTYYVEGPRVLSVHSRLAFPKLTKKIKPYEFKIIIDEVDSFNINHHFRVDPHVLGEHPKHAYTISGKDVINIPKGNHRIDLIPVDNKSKILVRLIAKLFKKDKGVSKDHIEIRNSEKLENHIITINDNNLKYFSILNDSLSKKNNKNTLSFKVKEGSSIIKITSRTTFDKVESKGSTPIKSVEKQKNKDNGYYQFKIRQNDKLISNHHMFSSPLEQPRILIDNSFQISKYRTTFISIPKGGDNYEIELVSPNDRPVLFRVVEKK